MVPGRVLLRIASIDEGVGIDEDRSSEAMTSVREAIVSTVLPIAMSSLVGPASATEATGVEAVMEDRFGEETAYIKLTTAPGYEDDLVDLLDRRLTFIQMPFGARPIAVAMRAPRLKAEAGWSGTRPAMSISFTSHHAELRQWTNADRNDADGDGVVIAILDTPVDTDALATVASSPPGSVDELGSFRHGRAQATLTNDPPSGHGTLIAALVRTLAPAARVELWEVLSTDGRLERDGSDLELTINAAHRHGADIMCISLSIEDDGGDGSGRLIGALDGKLDDKMARPDAPLFVAAAGNREGTTQQSMAFPACSAHTVAIGSMTSARNVAALNRTGGKAGAPPVAFFLAPGGDGVNGQVTDPIGSVDGTAEAGTSFACAWAVALIARQLAARRDQTQTKQETARTVIGDLASAADSCINGYSLQDAGHGLMRLP